MRGLRLILATAILAACPSASFAQTADVAAAVANTLARTADLQPDGNAAEIRGKTDRFMFRFRKPAA